MARITSSLFIVTVFVFLFSALNAAPAVTLPELTTRGRSRVAPSVKRCSSKAPRKKKRSCFTPPRRSIRWRC